MDKLQLTGQNLGRVFNFRSSHLHAADLWCYWVKLPILNLKTWPKQLLGSLQLDIALPSAYFVSSPNGCWVMTIFIIICNKKLKDAAFAHSAIYWQNLEVMFLFLQFCSEALRLVHTCDFEVRFCSAFSPLLRSTFSFKTQRNVKSAFLRFRLCQGQLV